MLNGPREQVRAGAVEGAFLANEGREVLIQCRNNDSARFHATWLRDCCPCAACRDTLTGELVLDHLSVDSDIRVLRASAERTGLALEWSDGHAACFDWSWLSSHAKWGDGFTGHPSPLPTWGSEFSPPTSQTKR